MLEGKVEIVAGASRGIGAGTAMTVARAGARVVLGARDETALEHVAGAIRAAGGEAIVQITDVGDAGAAERLVDRAMTAFGRLDTAFNNATDGGMPAPLDEIDPDDFDRAIRTNVRGTFLGMKYQIPAMRASGGGAIVNMASIAGVKGVANLAGYVAGKAGIIALTKVAALENADRGIRVNVVAPGPILTHHLERAGAEAQAQAAQAVPIRRVGSVQEVADAVVWLASDHAAFITGVTLPIDGAQSAGLKPPQMYRMGEPMASAR